MTKTVNGERKERTIRLDWQGDPERLDALYWEYQTGRHERQQAPNRYTWRVLVETWRADPRVQNELADGTKRSYRREMDALLERNGTKDDPAGPAKGARDADRHPAES